MASKKLLKMPIVSLMLCIASVFPNPAFAIIKGVSMCDMAQHAEKEAFDAQVKAFDAKKILLILQSLKSDAPEYALVNARKALQQYETEVDSSLASFVAIRKNMEQAGENINCPDVIQP